MVVTPLEPHQQRVRVEVPLGLAGGQCLEAEAQLREAARALRRGELTPGLEVGDPHARHRGTDLVALLREVDLGDLLGLAVGLAAPDDGLLGGHRHGDQVDPLLAVVADLHAEDRRADLEGELGRDLHRDVGERDAHLASSDGLEGAGHHRRGEGGIRLVDGADRADVALEELGVRLPGSLDLLGALHVAESRHVGPPQAWKSLFAGPMRAASGASFSTSKP